MIKQKKRWFYLLFFLASSPVLSLSEMESISFSRQGSEFFLKVKNARLEQILSEVAEETGILFHFSILPQTPIAAACVGLDIKEIMECLVGGQVAMAFRYSSETSDLAFRQPVEVWMLGSSLVKDLSGVCHVDVKAHDEEKGTESPRVGSEPSLKEKEMFYSKLSIEGTTQERMHALAYLTVHTDNDNDFNTLIAKALIDDDIAVRIQAMTSLVARGGEDRALSELERALNDSNPALRLAALQLVNDNKVLIEQLLNDDNEQVRTYAARKLKSIDSTNFLSLDN